MVADLKIEGLEQLTEIGRGGSARVFRAYQSDLERIVAVKVLNSSSGDEGPQRFDRERRAMGRLSDHAGIVPIYETGQTESGEPYIVMPYYQKGSLADAIAGGEPMPWQRATALTAAVAETVEVAHDKGIIHCDIKPANIMLHDDGRPKIADFGISRTRGTVAIDGTSPQTFTPAYSPPEVFLGSSREPTVDVYGMGATFFALLTGRPPFNESGGKSNVMTIINRVAHQPIPDLPEAVPEPIRAFVERAMAKNPADRPQDIPRFLSDLKAAVRASTADTPASISPAAQRPEGIPVPLRSISVNQTPEPIPRSPLSGGGIARPRLATANGIAIAVIGLVFAAGLVAVWRTDGPSTTPVVPSDNSSSVESDASLISDTVPNATTDPEPAASETTRP